MKPRTKPWRQRNSTVCTSRVGTGLRQRRHSVSRRIAKTLVRCHGGPLHGYSLCLSSEHPITLPFAIRGEVGRYAGGKWQPHKETQCPS